MLNWWPRGGMVDTTDLKSVPFLEYQFESGRGYQNILKNKFYVKGNFMLGFATIGTNNIQESCKFYDVVLLSIGMKKIITTERYIGYAKNNNLEKIIFYLMVPFNKKSSTSGNGTMIAFLANSRLEVNNFHKIAIEKGAVNEGFPGLRPSDGSDYYAYIRDFDGNKICAYYTSN